MYRLSLYCLRLLLLLSLTAALVGKAVAGQCPETTINVHTGNQELHTLICEAATASQEFLANLNLSPKREIHIDLSDAPVGTEGYSAFGSYDSRSDRITLMSPTAIAQLTPAAMMYGEPFDQDHYRGAVAHEVCHAIVHHNIRERPRSTGPQEYLAHATQMALLPAARRQAIIARSGASPWESGDVLSDIYMAMEPTGFAVKSYLHLTGLSNPETFVHILLGTKWFYVTIP